MSGRCRSLRSLPQSSVSSSTSISGHQGNIKDLLPPSVSQNPESNAVFLNVYDLDEGVVRLNSIMAKIGLGGAFHVGVSIYGKEYYYSGVGPPETAEDVETDPSGVYWHEPTHHDVHVYRESAYLGSTALSERQVYELVRRLGAFWTVGRYDLLRRNCCQFAEAFAGGLGVGPIPKEFYVLSRRLSAAADSLGGALGAVAEAVGWMSQPAGLSGSGPLDSASTASSGDKPVLIVNVSPLSGGMVNPQLEKTITVPQGEALFGRTNMKRQANFHMLAHPSISRTHALLRLSGSAVTIVDLGSVNGTRVVSPRLGHRSAELLTPRRPRKLNLYLDEFVVLGAVSLRLRLAYPK
ncbi:hypothetical protein FOL47_002725 [Perkinsus chesapeaki]|uniref:Desumoylating isopeptidase 1 n=1 Tax=Perkinsus chesapeaki TaxID=330153 RepID=A0A7J6MBZ5_PERCH|nr:hypothetical protein FOL47_002725 [Perkinsus chesapeaki]